ncbi:rhodanese-like domain-containing protein [Oscillatoria laete-virens NRMC-F 0139]|jgi:phage shock protein E|nr:rhodanese-like domain-containing protein [Oscillatoria laete-virens]MDL5054593.1 rhodanese-like domain-containing protein [Oscillatoria laete-virens NRMC-F 0139]
MWSEVNGMFTGKNRVLFVVVSVLVALGLIVVLAGSNNPAVNGTAAVQLITPASYQDRFAGGREGHLLIDVRTPAEFASGHIAGAVNIPVDELASRLSEVPQGQPVVVYCRSGNRSAQASRILAQAGYSDIYDLGGLNAWTAQGLPVQ